MVNKRKKLIEDLKSSFIFLHEANESLRKELGNIRAKMTIMPMMKDLVTSKFMKQLSDEALRTEVISKIYAEEEIGSLKFCLIDEFIQRYNKLRFPGEKNELC